MGSFRIERSRRALLITALLTALLPSLAAAEGEGDIPEKLKPWKNPAYTQRYFLKVAAPGEAGGINLQSEPSVASVILPLKMIGVGDAAGPEPILVLGEDGSPQSILSRRMAGGSEIEIAFRTRPGLRRYCLYAGAATTPNEVSATDFEPTALRVKMRGRTASQKFQFNQDTPYTLERLVGMNESNDGSLGVRNVANIDAPENPFFNIRVNDFGHIQKVDNPLHYTAVYEGFLRAPISGSYGFSIDTLGVAHLVIDGTPVVGAFVGDAKREPFTVKNQIDLAEGLHRVVVYYAEATGQAGKSAMALNQFGIRLHWKPPFAAGLMCIPPQAFPRAVPAVVTRVEAAQDAAVHFLHVELLGQVQTGLHRGDDARREWIQLAIKHISIGGSLRIRAESEGQLLQQSDPGAEFFACWIPAGKAVKLSLTDGEATKFERNVTFATAENGGRDVVNLEAELLCKSAPDFVYPHESGFVHVESVLSQPPRIVYKERTESEMIPPPPRPMGEFRLSWGSVEADTGRWISEAKVQSQDITPVSGKRRKALVTFSGKEGEEEAKSGARQWAVLLSIAGLEVDAAKFRLLHSQSANWPGVLVPTGSTVDFQPKDRTEKERAVIFVPMENESEYRLFAGFRIMSNSNVGKSALFLGDPLVEDAKPGAATGLAEKLEKEAGGYTWETLQISGPYRHQPILQILADTESHIAALEGKKLPGLVVLSLGMGDAARQTPIHTFERAMDVLIDRLRSAGARKILVVGPVPEPYRERQAITYQERLVDLLRQHHIHSVDVVDPWTKKDGWTKFFALPSEGGDESSELLGATPNAAGWADIVEKILKKL